MKKVKNKTYFEKITPTVDKLTYLAAVLETIIVMPQVYQIFRDKDASGVSLASWTGFEILNLIWLLYGVVHKEKLIIFYATAYGVVQFWVIVGGVMYGAKWF